MIAIITYESI